jgi:hypothetical protein
MRRSRPLLAIFAVALAGLLLAASQAASAAKPPARTIVEQAKKEWLRAVRASARDGDRATIFPSPSRAILFDRLRLAQRRYGFQIVSVRTLHPLQAAPVIVIRSNKKRAIARATPAIVERFDPRHVTRGNPSDYAYEAYFFEAQDGHGVPYLVTFNHWRAPHVGGGEWAAAESLYPFPHG